MQNTCQVSTAELDQPGPSSCVAYRHDHGRMASLSPDGLVRIYAPDTSEQQWDLLCQTQLQPGRPIQASWAHAQYGALLAALMDQGEIVILEEVSVASQTELPEMARIVHEGCCAVSFGPREDGLQLASACSSGHIRVHQAEAGKAGTQWVLQHELCAGTFSRCTALCWRDHSVGLPQMLLLGTEHGAQVFCYDGQHRCWHSAAQFGEGTLTDVSWTTPAAGHAPEYVAIAAGRTASVWKLEGSADKLQVSKAGVLEHGAKICQIEWNASGTWLAVATDDGRLSLWRQNLLGSWKLVSTTEAVIPGSYIMVD